MPQVDNYVTENARRTYESSNFGTRKLAFYMVNLPHSYGMADNWQEPNSLYYQIVQMLQKNGAELYWLGQPQYYNNLGYDDCFTFAMADDADQKTELVIPVSQSTTVATATDTSNFIILDSTNNIYAYNTTVVFTGTPFGGIIPGKKYYVQGIDGNGIQVSEEPNGSIIEFTADTGSMTADTAGFDIQWTGTAGDVLFGCCGGGPGPFQCISAVNFIFGQNSNGGLFDITEGYGWIERLVPTSAIAPRWTGVLHN